MWRSDKTWLHKLKKSKVSLLPVLTDYISRRKMWVQCDNVFGQTLGKNDTSAMYIFKKSRQLLCEKSIHFNHILDLPRWRKKVVTCSQPKQRENVGQSRTDHLIADIHVLFMVIVSSVDFGLLPGPRCAVTFYRLRRQSRVIRILPLLPFLLTVVALFFFIIIPGDLWKETNGCDILKHKHPSLGYSWTATLTVCKNEDCVSDIQHQPWHLLSLHLISSPALVLCLYFSFSCCWSVHVPHDCALYHSCGPCLFPYPFSFPSCVCRGKRSVRCVINQQRHFQAVLVLFGSHFKWHPA